MMAAALANPPKNAMHSPSIVRYTATAAMAGALCLPSTMLMSIVEIPMAISFMRIGKHFLKNSFINPHSK